MRERCLSYALEGGEKHGVWGGTSAAKRDRIRKAAAGRPVRILSARHGLVTPATILAPYNTTMTMTMTMTDRDSIPAARLTEQLAALPGAELLTIHAYLPRAYRARLVDAITDLTRPCQVRDGYAGCRRIGEQRRVIARLGGRS